MKKIILSVFFVLAACGLCIAAPGDPKDPVIVDLYFSWDFDVAREPEVHEFKIQKQTLTQDKDIRYSTIGRADRSAREITLYNVAISTESSVYRVVTVYWDRAKSYKYFTFKLHPTATEFSVESNYISKTGK